MKRSIADSVASFVAQSLLLSTLAGLSASAVAQGPFTLSSTEVKQNATIADAQVFKGFGCAQLEECTGSDEKFCRNGLRSRRANR
jgi:hypothetical protein